MSTLHDALHIALDAAKDLDYMGVLNATNVTGVTQKLLTAEKAAGTSVHAGLIEAARADLRKSLAPDVPSAVLTASAVTKLGTALGNLHVLEPCDRD